ncbi:hypothetical protein G3O08_06430 [Cryomorpha ignava]|uniref:YceI family protein n=1 Tax=Cryomorpha ignava TaxID=101383 RepID=A0A7K3WNA2_9FLAO|nr:hypothetical protein [Cryomorpha ignava]NEN23133.1 hypothetical protein [Cryomorpha ignava]
MESKRHIFISQSQKHALSIFGLLATFCFPTVLHGQNKLHPVILESAQLEISGNTNISDFICQLAELDSNDTLSYVLDTKTGAELFEGMELKFCVADFICDKSLMTSDLKTSLKEKEFPYITMKINKVTAIEPHKQNGSQMISAYITLLIAGYAQHEYIEHALITNTNNHLTLTGMHNVLMTKFQIEPPTKLFGAVHTDDSIEISFSIKLR